MDHKVRNRPVLTETSLDFKESTNRPVYLSPLREQLWGDTTLKRRAHGSRKNGLLVQKIGQSTGKTNKQTGKSLDPGSTGS